MRLLTWRERCCKPALPIRLYKRSAEPLEIANTGIGQLTDALRTVQRRQRQERAERRDSQARQKDAPAQ